MPGESFPCIPVSPSSTLSLGISERIGRKPIDSAHPPHKYGACKWDAAQSFQGVDAMFRIIKYRNDSGKILMTIETDDQMAADFCRFFGTINKFVDLFNYRVRSAKSFELYQKTASHKMALLKKEFAEQLERFRSMPGTRIERMRILKEIRVSNGEQVPLDRIDAEIRRAIQYEKEDKLAKIKKLHDSGKSLDDIANALDIPKTTVARYLKKHRPPETPQDGDSRLASIAPLKRA
jgi:hypothetical protein